MQPKTSLKQAVEWRVDLLSGELCQGSSDWTLRKRLFPEVVVVHWSRPSKEVVMARSVSQSKEHPDILVIWSIFRLSCKEQGIRLDDPCMSLPAQDIIGF